MSSSKRTGRYGDPPRTGERNPLPPFGEHKGAPLPLLTQPMVAVEVREVREIGADPKQTLLDGAVPTLKIESAAIMPSKLDPTTVMPAKLEPSALIGKLDSATVVHGKPTVMMGPQIKPSGMPQIDLTQHHLPDDNVDPRLTLVIDPDSERSAAFRVLRHHLLEVGRPQVVIVSSPQVGDGKTTTAVNLALALAECGRARTLLVETHVRRPQLTTVFQFIPPWCFAEQLAAHRHQPTMPWSLIDIPQLWLHVAAINPRIAQTQLLDGPAFAIAMERLRMAGYDHIVVDAPPVLGSADVNLMTDAADSVVLALRARRSNTRDLRRAIDQLGTTKVAGTVLLR
ncbi:MAG: CpsD/CapB family tyrosine-protein kinase [Deltaproteobacteria bacterium]|nr:MAG: CpsD/CapB family tyrosine-protein kinase [Deltaproteobacteria bacterium]TMQ07532.1 MAG: CpsD/CapB family tyrosine-protein kinase [Deltaproteobacteria bacterium]